MKHAAGAVLALDDEGFIGESFEAPVVGKLSRIDTRCGATFLAQPTLHAGHRLLRALEVALHRAPGRVPAPAHHAQLNGPLLSALAEEDALHAAKHLKINANQPGRHHDTLRD